MNLTDLTNKQIAELRDRCEREVVAAKGLQPRPLDDGRYMVLVSSNRNYWVVCGHRCAARVAMDKADTTAEATKIALRSEEWKFDGIDAAVGKAMDRALATMAPRRKTSYLRTSARFGRNSKQS